MTDLSAPSLVPPDRSNLAALLFGMMGGPFFWIAQIVAGYITADLLCYNGQHPAIAPSADAVATELIVFDAIAVVGVLTALAVSIISWVRLSHRSGSSKEPKESRSQFMAIWGIFSGIWFLGAIIFNSIGDIVVPICLR